MPQQRETFATQHRRTAVVALIMGQHASAVERLGAGGPRCGVGGVAARAASSQRRPSLNRLWSCQKRHSAPLRRNASAASAVSNHRIAARRFSYSSSRRWRYFPWSSSISSGSAASTRAGYRRHAGGGRLYILQFQQPLERERAEGLQHHHTGLTVLARSWFASEQALLKQGSDPVERIPGTSARTLLQYHAARASSRGADGFHGREGATVHKDAQLGKQPLQRGVSRS